MKSVSLLGLQITDTLSWGAHVDYMVRKAQKRLYCLNMLRRSKVTPMDIIHIYCSKIRPVLEYASAVWHAGLTKEQSDSTEHIQERALRIDYQDALKYADLPSLSERRVAQCKSLYLKMQNPENKLYRLLPDRRVNTRNTRSSLQYQLPKVHTDRYKNSFLPFVLYNCQ